MSGIEMKKLFLTSIAVLSVLASAAHAREWQGNMPKPIAKLPSYPPIVCVTPNWTPEPCESRQSSAHADAWAGTALGEYDEHGWDEIGKALGEASKFWNALEATAREIHDLPNGIKVTMDPTDLFAIAKLTSRELPPPEYDHPYLGKVLLIYAKRGTEIWRLCNIEKSAHPGITLAGCAFPRPEADTCVIVISNEDLLAPFGLTLRIVLRHEIGHCNGWPGSHPGIR